MEHKNKIALVVRKMTFAEAEEADDLYWTNASIEERLNTLYDLRRTIFDETALDEKIAKVVVKRSFYDED